VSGFSYRATKDGRVSVAWQGRTVRTFVGESASRLLERLRSGDEQLELARVTGNFKRGNER
jgi:hypothetical protein